MSMEPTSNSSIKNTSSAPTPAKITTRKIPDPDFTGKWRLKEYIGIDEYLKSEGWNWMMRKAIPKIGNSQYIYHHHISSIEGKEEEEITIKSVYKGGIYEMISQVNLNDKKEIKYMDKNGNKVISVFKWNRDKTEVIEFLLIDIKHNEDEKGRRDGHGKARRRLSKKKQKSYTKSRSIAVSGQMIENITNENGKTCISIYVKDEEDQISIDQLKNILHLEYKKKNIKRATDIDSLQFPMNILDLKDIWNQNKDKMDKLNMDNIIIQKEILEITNKIMKLEEELRMKTEELKENIAKNDENIAAENTVKKWNEFESEWSKWDTLYFIGWLRRIKWTNKEFDHYHITKYRINYFCMKQFNNTTMFYGKYLVSFDCDALRQIGIEDEKDSFCVYQQILDLTKRFPIKQYISPLKYVNKNKNKNKNKNTSLKMLLNDNELIQYYPLFIKIGFDDINTICDCIKHKGIQYLEQNILSKKLKINKMEHRIKLLTAFEKYNKDNQHNTLNQNNVDCTTANDIQQSVLL